jgi:hypothetical protein
MGVGDFLGKLGVDIDPSGGFLGFNFLGDVLIFLILCVLAIVVTYFILQRKSYNKTIVKFKEINGITRRVGMEKAKEIVLPGTSVRAFFIKRSKFFIPRPSRETGDNEFWYFIRNDGEWVNVGLANLNKELKELGLHYDHTDMRMANAALKRLVDKSYKKTSWLKEYAPYIGFAVIIIMLAIGGYLVMGESAKVVGSTSSNVEALARITETMDGILGKLNNIVSSSGVTPA